MQELRGLLVQIIACNLDLGKGMLPVPCWASYQAIIRDVILFFFNMPFADYDRGRIPDSALYTSYYHPKCEDSRLFYPMERPRETLLDNTWLEIE